MSGDLIRRVRSAGVVGSGGGPAWIKLSQRADALIANGTECRPLGRADGAALARYPEEIARGLRLAMQEVGASEGFLAVRADQPESGREVEAAIARDGHLAGRMSLVTVPAVYPAGEDGQLAYQVTGRLAPAGGTPLDAGVAVFGVRTLLAIGEAARDQAATHQLVAVMGAVARPATVWAPRGIPLAALVAAAGGGTAGAEAVYLPEGPMHGAPAGPQDPLGYGVSLLVVLPPGHAATRKLEADLAVHLRRTLSACESCEQCTAMCPAHLAGQPVEPHKVMRAVAYGLDAMIASIAGAATCVGCGLCTHYACPVDLAPSIVTLAVKRRLAAGGYVPPLAPAALRPGWGDRRVPLERLIARLDLARFDVPAPVAGTIAAERVLLPLALPGGIQAAPLVRDGLRVKAGQRVADVPEGSAGVPVVASIDGRVRLTPRGIEIST